MSILTGIARFRFHEGRVEDFKRLSRECMDRVERLDTGTLRYDIYLNADESEAIVIEEQRAGFAGTPVQPFAFFLSKS